MRAMRQVHIFRKISGHPKVLRGQSSAVRGPPSGLFSHVSASRMRSFFAPRAGRVEAVTGDALAKRGFASHSPSRALKTVIKKANGGNV